MSGKSGLRNAPSILNRGLGTSQFRDGRAETLEEQALGPIENPLEMDLAPEEAVKRLNQDSELRTQFEAIFGGPATPQRLAKVLAAFERTLLVGDAPVDRMFEGKAASGGTLSSSMSDSARRGMQVFHRRGRCVQCHQGATFSDESFHNLGIGMPKEAREPSEAYVDWGRFEVTQEEKDRGAFRTPSLRNVADTAPYMHDGSMETLTQVVEFYDAGGKSNPWLSPKLRPLGLTAEEKADLIQFLKEGLTGSMPKLSLPQRMPLPKPRR